MSAVGAASVATGKAMWARDRRALGRAAAALMLSPLLGPAQAEQRRLRRRLNTSLSGPVAFFLLAQDRGYLRDEGLDIVLSPGSGAAAIVPQVRHGAYDAGYGDMSALIERIARGAPEQGPVAIYTTFNVVPFTIASRLPKTESIALLVEKNPNVLAASFNIPAGTEAGVTTRVKMGQTSNVTALVKADGKFYYTTKEVKVTMGGCGG